MNDAMPSHGTALPSAGRARRLHSLPLLLAAFALVGTPALWASGAGHVVSATVAQAPTKVKVEADAKTKSKTRELVVVAEPGDQPDGGVWMTKVLGGGYLGVELLPMTQELRTHFGAPEDRGVLVSRVEEGSPAAKAGLQAGDVITRMDDEAVESPWDLTLAVRGHEKGDTARIALWRDGKPLDFEVQLDERERRKIDLGQLVESGDDGRKTIRLKELLSPGDGPPLMYLHPEAMDRLGESLDKVDWPRLDERLGQRNRELEKRLDELEKRLDELQKELDRSTGKPK